MNVNRLDVQMLQDEENEAMTYVEEIPMSILIPPTEDEISCPQAPCANDNQASTASTTPSLSIPASVQSSSMAFSQSLDSSSSVEGFHVPPTCPSLASDRELVNLECRARRQEPIEIQIFDLSTNTRKPHRRLKSLKALSALTNLVQLKLAGNAVERLDGLQVFTQLQTLALPRNHLKMLTAPLFALKKLTHLDLSGNFITHLPRAFSGLVRLQVLNLSGNNLGTLREVDVLTSLGNLSSCNLAANPFCGLPTYRDYVLCKLGFLERLDDVQISHVARDRAAKRYGSAMFSQDACLREAGRAHEDQQKRLLEAQSALEAENLRLKGELQVKSKLLQNKSRAWSSATEQLLQLQQEVAMLNLNRTSIALTNVYPSEAEQIAMAIAARHQLVYSGHQRPQSAPRFSSPECSTGYQRGPSSDCDVQVQRETEDVDKKRAIESRDAECMSMISYSSGGLSEGRKKEFTDASCSPLRAIPSDSITAIQQHDMNVDTHDIGDDQDDGKQRQASNDDPPSCQTLTQDERVSLIRPIVQTPPADSFDSSQQERERAQSVEQSSRKQPHDDNVLEDTRPISTSLECDLKEDEPFGRNATASAPQTPNFEDTTACPAYEDPHDPALHTRSSSAGALHKRRRDSSNDVTFPMSETHSLPPSPAASPFKIRQWYQKQQLLTPPPSPPQRNRSVPRKVRPSAMAIVPLTSLGDKCSLARQLQALQSCKQSLLTEIRNEEHLMHVLKQESAQYEDQIHCLSVNVPACVDDGPSGTQVAISLSNVPRNDSRKLCEDDTGRARLELLRKQFQSTEDREKEIEMTMMRMSKRVLQADLNPLSRADNIPDPCNLLETFEHSKVPFDKEIFALTHKLQLVIVEKEEIYVQMSQLMAQLRRHTKASLDVNDDENVSARQVQSLAKCRQMVNEMRTRHRQVLDRIQLKEKRVSSLVAELKEVEAELQYISSLNESSALSPLFQRECAANFKFLQTLRRDEGIVDEFREGKTVKVMEIASESVEVSAHGMSSPSSGQLVPLTHATWTDGGLQASNLYFKDFVNSEMLEEMKANIYEKLSQQLALSAKRSRDGSEGHVDEPQAIAVALETRLQHEINGPQVRADEEGRDICRIENLQPNDSHDEDVDSIHKAKDVEMPLVDEVCNDHVDEFARVDPSYARKYVMVKDRVSRFLQSLDSDDVTRPAHVVNAQRIIKIGERLEAAKAQSELDPVSKIEVDRQGNSRGSLKIVLLAARDLPTAHLRTKNLDPYVSLEVVYPSHALPSCARSSTGRIVRSQTKKKSIYPVWDEDFELAPILSLNGYLHVRILNDRRLGHEQLVGETRIPLHTLLHQKRLVEWYSIGLNVAPHSSESKTSGRVVSNLCGGAVRLQLQLFYSSVERYKQVVDELVMRYQHEYNELPPFIDAIDECNDYEEIEQPEQNGVTTDSKALELQRQTDVASSPSHNEGTSPNSSKPNVQYVEDSSDNGEVSRVSTSDDRLDDRPPCSSSMQLLPERHKSVTVTASIDAKKSNTGSMMNWRKQPSSSVVAMSEGSRRNQLQFKRVRSLQQHSLLRDRRDETPECFDEYSPYHPSFKAVDPLEGCNNEHSNVKSSRTIQRHSEWNRKTDLSIFKSPSLSRRPPSSGFPERYIGLDNQTCERLKRIIGRMDGTSSDGMDVLK